MCIYVKVKLLNLQMPTMCVLISHICLIFHFFYSHIHTDSFLNISLYVNIAYISYTCTRTFICNECFFF